MASDTSATISLDQTYHYPPELMEMLTEAIPCLFKGKQAVIDFLKGASTPPSFLEDWRAKVNADRDSVKKHEIVRDVLRQLNEGGDRTLAARRAESDGCEAAPAAGRAAKNPRRVYPLFSMADPHLRGPRRDFKSAVRELRHAGP